MANHRGFTVIQVAEIVSGAIQLETSVSKLNKMVGGLFALVLLLAMANTGTSIAVAKLTSSSSTQAEGAPLLVPTTVARGESFVLDAERREDGLFTGVSPEDSAAMWNALSSGVATTARWLERDEETGIIVEEQGMTLHFDGATHNETHVCFPTEHAGRTFCIDFTSNDCYTGQEGEPDDHHGRRKLFQYLTGDAETKAKMDDLANAEYQASQEGGLRRLQCGYCCQYCCSCGGSGGWKEAQ